MRQDLAQLIKQYGNRASQPENKARIIVFDEQGVVSPRESWKITLPIYIGGGWNYYSISLPYYPDRRTDVFAPLLLDDSKLTPSTLVDVNLMAQQDLTERMPSMVFRQVLRVVAKDQVRREVAQGDDVGNVLLNVWNVLTEQADTRSWQTLPAAVFSSSEYVTPGKHQISWGHVNYSLSVQAGETVLVILSRQGTGSVIWHKNLGNL